MSSSYSRAAFRIAVVALFCSFLSIPAGVAQENQPGRKVVRDLFRAWLESELEKAERGSVDDERARRQREERLREEQMRDQRRREQDERRHRDDDHRHQVGNSRDLREFQANIDGYSQTLELLSSELQGSVKQDRSLRPLLAECYKMRTNVEWLKKRSRSVADLGELRDDYAQLDSNWRDLAYQLRSARLSRRADGYISQLDRDCNQFCSVFEVNPQFDRQRLGNLVVREVAFVHALLDDLDIELDRSRDRERLLSEGRKIHEMLRRNAARVNTDSYENLVRQFAQFDSAWAQFSGKLYSIDNPHIRRRIGRIRSVVDSMAQVLRRETSVNHDHVLLVAEQMAAQMQEVLDQMTIREFLLLPANQRAALLEGAATLKGECQRLCDCAKRKQPLNTMKEYYNSTHRQWARMDSHLEGIDSERISKCRRQVSVHDQELRRLLGVNNVSTSRSLQQLANELNAAGEQLHDQVEQLNSRYKTREFGSRANSAATAFCTECKRFGSEAARAPSDRRMRSAANSLIRSWAELNSVVESMPQNGIRARHFKPISKSRQDIAEKLAEMAAYLSN